MAAAQAAEIGDVPLDIEGLHKKMVTEPSGDGKELKNPKPPPPPWFRARPYRSPQERRLKAKQRSKGEKGSKFENYGGGSANRKNRLRKSGFLSIFI